MADWHLQVSRALQRASAIQRACLIAAPALLLVYDFVCFPTAFAIHGLKQNTSVVSLVTNRLVLLGTYNNHTIHVSLDSIRRKDFLDYINGSPNAIVLTYFVEPESPEWLGEGDLSRALQAKLKGVSPEVSRGYQDQLHHLKDRQPGDVLKLDVRMPQERYRELPIDRVYAVLAKTKGESNRRVLATAIPQVLERAARENISSLIIPCIGYNWANKNSVTFDEFFHPLFSSLPLRGAPAHIYLPLYTDWPTFTLEEAVKSLNRCWEEIVAGSTPGVMFGLYRADYRLTLFFLTICLLVSSFYAALTVKNFLIICFAFLAMSTGALKTADFVTQGYSSAVCSIVKIATLIFLATGFPFLINWNPKNVFRPESNPT